LRTSEPEDFKVIGEVYEYVDCGRPSRSAVT